jgi:hypothetical protein
MFLILTGALTTGAVAVYRLFVLERREPHHIRGIGLLLSVCALALALRLWAVPQMHHVFYDEFVFMSEAHSILHLGTAGSLTKGSAAQIEQTFPMSFRAGFSLLLAIVSAVAGERERMLFLFNVFLGVFSVGIVFRMVRTATESLPLAWWTAAVLALLPCHVKYSDCLSADTAGLFFLLFFVMCLGEWSRARQKAFMLAALFAGGYSACIKPVYLPFIIIGLLLVTVPMYRRKELKGKELGDVLYYALCVVVPMAVILSRMSAAEAHNSVDAFYSWGHLKKYFISNLGYLFNPWQANVAASVLFVIGLGRSIFRDRGAFSTTMAAWFAAGFLLISGYYAGGMSNEVSTDSDRFFFLVALPFAFLAARGVQAVLGTVARRAPLLTEGAGVALFAMLLGAGVFSSRAVAGITPHRFVHEQLLFLKYSERFIPDDAYVVFEVPAFVTTQTSKKAIAPALFFSQDLPRRVVYWSGGCATGRTMAPDIEKAVQRSYDCRPITVSPSGKKGCALTMSLCELKKGAAACLWATGRPVAK